MCLVLVQLLAVVVLVQLGAVVAAE